MRRAAWAFFIAGSISAAAIAACVGDESPNVTANDGGDDAPSSNDGAVSNDATSSSDGTLPSDGGAESGPTLPPIPSANGVVSLLLDLPDPLVDSTEPQFSAIDPNGNIVIATTLFYGSVILGGKSFSSSDPNHYATFIARFDPTGKFLAGQTFGTYYPIAHVAGDILPTALSVDSDGEIYVAATTTGNIFNGSYYPNADAGGAQVGFVVRLASLDLSVVWKSAPLSGPSGCGGLATKGQEIIATCNTSGDVALSGANNQSLLLTGKGLGDMLVVSLQDSTGAVGWARLIGGTDNDSVGGVAIAPDSSIRVAGSFKSSVLADSAAGGFTVNKAAGTGINGIVLSLDPAKGDTQWSRLYEGAGDVAGSTMGVDGYGNAWTVGTFSGGNVDFSDGGNPVPPGAASGAMFAVKLDPKGKELEQFVLPVLNLTGLTAVVDIWGNLIVGSSFQGTVNFPAPNAPLAVTNGQGLAPLFFKLNPDGTMAWVKRFAGPTNGMDGDDSSECEVYASVGGNGNVGAVGRIYGTWSVDTKNVNPTAMTEVDASRGTDQQSHGFLMMLSP